MARGWAPADKGMMASCVIWGAPQKGLVTPYRSQALCSVMN